MLGFWRTGIWHGHGPWHGRWSQSVTSVDYPHTRPSTTETNDERLFSVRGLYVESWMWSLCKHTPVRPHLLIFLQGLVARRKAPGVCSRMIYVRMYDTIRPSHPIIHWGLYAHTYNHRKRSVWASLASTRSFIRRACALQNFSSHRQNMSFQHAWTVLFIWQSLPRDASLLVQASLVEISWRAHRIFTFMSKNQL